MQPDRTEELAALLSRRILVLDGAMGTMIQRHKLGEDDFRGGHAGCLHDHAHDLKGDNDLLVLTQPDVIREIHDRYLEAGRRHRRDQHLRRDVDRAGRLRAVGPGARDEPAAARLARECADRWTARTPEKPRFVAGALGPTNRTASISPDVNDPGARNVTFDELVATYGEAADGLIDGGADILLVETVFDTLNAKAALFAIEDCFERRGARLPVIVSGTITDASGRTLSGQTTEAFWNSVRHVRPLAVGLNCALGAALMRPYIEEMARVADVFVSCYPNAGLPNPMAETGYDETPEQTARLIEDFARNGFVNIVGGCCGTTPAHIRAIAAAVAAIPPRALPVAEPLAA